MQLAGSDPSGTPLESWLATRRKAAGSIRCPGLGQDSPPELVLDMGVASLRATQQTTKLKDSICTFLRARKSGCSSSAVRVFATSSLSSGILSNPRAAAFLLCAMSGAGGTVFCFLLLLQNTCRGGFL